MANFIDEDEDNVEQTENETTEYSEEPQEVPEEQEEELPERYRNKDVKEIIRMHQEAEKALGRQGSEVGELRRVVDDFIKAQSVTQQQQAPESVEDDDFFSDPDKAIARAIERHPKIKEAEQLSQQWKVQSAQAKLVETHPDFTEVVGSQDFQQWVQASPVRLELYARADRQFDFNAANELLSTYKERQQVANNAAAVEKASRSQQVKQASTGTTQGSSETSKKIYRRQDIIELMRRDPDRYEALQPEILKAYAERRVR